MGWLLAPMIPKRRFPKPVFKQKRAINLEERQKIMAREKNPERRAFYELAWHTRASHSDLANLHAEDIDWTNRVISCERMKLLGRKERTLPRYCF